MTKMSDLLNPLTKFFVNRAKQEGIIESKEKEIEKNDK